MKGKSSPPPMRAGESKAHDTVVSEKHQLIQDISSGLDFDSRGKVLASIIDHLETQCSPEEIGVMLKMALSLEPKKYRTFQGFVDDYQEILDIVDFPIMDAVKHWEKHVLKMQDLDKLVGSESGE